MSGHGRAIRQSCGHPAAPDPRAVPVVSAIYCAGMGWAVKQFPPEVAWAAVSGFLVVMAAGALGTLLVLWMTGRMAELPHLLGFVLGRQEEAKPLLPSSAAAHHGRTTEAARRPCGDESQQRTAVGASGVPSEEEHHGGQQWDLEEFSGAQQQELENQQQLSVAPVRRPPLPTGTCFRGGVSPRRPRGQNRPRTASDGKQRSAFFAAGHPWPLRENASLGRRLLGGGRRRREILPI